MVVRSQVTKNASSSVRPTSAPPRHCARRKRRIAGLQAAGRPTAPSSRTRTSSTIPTVTAVGHATMLSGATPSVSGIIGNDWFDRASGATVTSVSDPTVSAVGSTTGSAASPRRLLVGTIGDELQIASPHAKGSPDAPRVFGVSLKDRSAILPSGRRRDAEYWRNTKTGRSSPAPTTWRAPPERVQRVQRSQARRHAGGSGVDGRSRRRPDADASAAGRARRGALRRRLRQSVRQRPAVGVRRGSSAARTARRRNAIDLLAISFSSNDSVGHTYGPDSPQVRDIAVRTDQDDRTAVARGRSRWWASFARPRRVDHRPRRGARAGNAPGAGPSRWTDDDEGIVRAASTGACGALRRGQVADGDARVRRHISTTSSSTRCSLDPTEVRRVAAAAAHENPPRRASLHARSTAARRGRRTIASATASSAASTLSVPATWRSFSSRTGCGRPRARRSSVAPVALTVTCSIQATELPLNASLLHQCPRPPPQNTRIRPDPIAGTAIAI